MDLLHCRRTSQATVFEWNLTPVFTAFHDYRPWICFTIKMYKNYEETCSGRWGFNPLPNDKILDVTKLKAFADTKSNIAKMTISLFDRAENTAGYQHFLLFPQCFPKPSFLGSLKVGTVW